MEWLKMLAPCPLVLAFMGCGGDDDDESGSSPQALCQRIADTQCTKIYDCFSAADLEAAGFPPTSSGCKSQLRDDLGCDAASADDLCEGNETFHASEANRCVDQMDSASCGQVMEAEDVTDVAPACDQVCTID
jgi:hypothetical protein